MWTFDDNLTAPKDWVRLLAGDTVSSAQLVSDELIAGILAEHANKYTAAAVVCRHLAARFSRQADQAIDDMRKSLSQRAKAFSERASELDEQATSVSGGNSVAVPFFGGITVAGKSAQREDTSLVRPLSTRDDMEFSRYYDEDYDS
jgi:hypothetical protein